MATRTTTIRATTTTFVASGDGSPSPNRYCPPPFTLEDVFDAYFACRRHKRNTHNQLRFEADLEANLVALWRDLSERRYCIGRSIAFVIRQPKIREVWAADFRDRIVHHLVYNALAPYYHPRFIRDNYACIPDRGIHDALRRVSGFARSASHSWSQPAYALKIDVANFFNSIDRTHLLAVLERRIAPWWCLDLARQIIRHDPRAHAFLKSPRWLFDQVPRHKSLLHAPQGIGLPIGNLTSQFFANVYLDELDQFVKHGLKARYYGRYVDDMVLLHRNPAQLRSWCAEIDSFLRERLALHLHPNKIWINRADAGIDFAGFLIKPGRTYLRRSTLNRCRQKIRSWQRQGAPVDPESIAALSSSSTSYLGMLRSVDGYRARKRICQSVENLFIRADEEYTNLLPVNR